MAIVTRTDAIVFTPPIDGGFVVGHDGSERGDRALQWALEDAAFRGGAVVNVVRAWQLANVLASIPSEPGIVPSYAECEVAVREHLHANLGRTEVPAGVVVREHVVHAPSAQALLLASAHADLVVVGDRGRGGFAGLLLGSTAEQVLRHASCPVVVVRGREGR